MVGFLMEGHICCILALPQRNMFYSNLTRNMCAKEVVSKQISKSVPSACETGALPSELLRSVKQVLAVFLGSLQCMGEKISAVSPVRK